MRAMSRRDGKGEAEDACALDAAALERHVADVDRESLVACLCAVGSVGLVCDADGSEAQEGKQRSRPGTHHDVHAPRAGRFVDGGALAAEAAVVRRDCAAGGERAAQPDYQALGCLYLRGQNQRLLTTLDRRARQRRDSVGLIRRGHSPHTGAAAPHGRLRAAQERVEVLRLLSSGEDGGGFRAPYQPYRAFPTSSRSALLAAPASDSRVAVAHAPPCSPKTSKSRRCRGARSRSGTLPSSINAHSTVAGSGAVGTELLPSASAVRSPSALGERLRLARPTRSPCCRASRVRVQHPVPAGVEAWREGGAQHYGQRHGGCLRDPPAKLDEVGEESPATASRRTSRALESPVSVASTTPSRRRPERGAVTAVPTRMLPRRRSGIR